MRAKEPGTVRYVITRSVAGKGGEEEEEVVMLERFVLLPLSLFLYSLSGFLSSCSFLEGRESEA